MKRDVVTYLKFQQYVEEAGLLPKLQEIVLAHHVTLHDVYLDLKGPSTIAARLECWWWLMKHGNKSRGEIGRIFHRDTTSILHGLRKVHAKADELRVQLDAGSIRIVAVAMGQQVSESWTRVGEKAAGRINERHVQRLAFVSKYGDSPVEDVVVAHKAIEEK